MGATRTSYPKMPVSAWWTLRTKFRQTVPTHVTPSYLATVLEMRESSAKTNVLPALKDLGLVAADGKPTPLAHRWRDDEAYSGVCKELVEAVYPSELRDAIPTPSDDGESHKQAAEWFMRTTGVGQAAARKMAAMYRLLAQARLPVAEEVASRTRKRRVSSGSKPASPVNDKPAPVPDGTPHKASTRIEMPELRISLEVRIDSSTTPEQIDHIFASMAKHLYDRDHGGQ